MRRSERNTEVETMKRRDFIKRSGLGAITAWAGSSLLLNACHTEEDMIGEPNWVVEGSFDRILTQPPTSSTGVLLTAQISTSEILKGRTSQTLSYANGLLGPTIRANKGETVYIALQNNLSEETNIHWHGLILPENMDGHPKDVATPRRFATVRSPGHATCGNILVSSPPTWFDGKAGFHGTGRNFHCK